MSKIINSCTLKIRGGVERDANGKKAGKGALIQWEKSATLGVSQDQTLFVFVTESADTVMSEKTTLTEKRFFEWHEDDVSVTLRNRGGSYGGGSEVLVICSIQKQSEHCAPQTTSGCSKSK